LGVGGFDRKKRVAATRAAVLSLRSPYTGEDRMQTDTTPPEETFDPESWDRFRALAHRMLDDTLDGLATLRDGPPWRPLPDGVRRALDAPVPREGAGEEAAYEEFVRHVLPYTNGNRHPRRWG
jgi:hypothetical protein